jgi:hypothetical protein
MTLQRLTLTLDGITAGDYMQWVRDPKPPALGLGLRSIEVRGEPLGDTVEAVLSWDVSPPPAIEAGPVAGLPLTPEVAAISSTTTKETNSWKPMTASLRYAPATATRCGSSATPTSAKRRARTPAAHSR